MDNKIKVDMGTHWLVCEVNPDPFFNKEIMCYLEEKETGVITQDIAIVRPHYYFKDDDSPTWDTDVVNVLVYGDNQNEDYTDDFYIDVYKEEE